MSIKTEEFHREVSEFTELSKWALTLPIGDPTRKLITDDLRRRAETLREQIDARKKLHLNGQLTDLHITLTPETPTRVGWLLVALMGLMTILNVCLLIGLPFVRTL